MTEQLDLPSIRLHLTGSVEPGESESLVLNFPISKGEIERRVIPHPGAGLTDNPVYLSSAIGTYGQAQNIIEVDQCNPRLGNLFLKMFTVIASYPNTEFIALDLEHDEISRFLLGTDKGLVFCWSDVKINEVYIAQELTDTVTELDNVFIPSELLYAFSIIAEHAHMGSKRFTVLFEEETKNVTVSFFDHEEKNHRTNVSFPKMRLSAE